ncbi:MAG: TRAP transporter substrate-binding protein [Candidatus Helarchaeota archaeon]|nr:TRAP transporter substrate-binding protein [Candidatus Helarchaeota archaeon]
MNIRKIIAVISLSFLCIVFSSDYSYSKEVLKLRLGTGHPLTHYWPKTGLSFASKVANYTDKQILVEVFPLMQLGAERDQLEGLRLGTVHLTITTMAVVTQFVPDFVFFQLPYLIRDYDHGMKVWNELLASRIADKMDKAGFHLLGILKSSPRGVQSTKPILKLADLKNMRIRTMEANIYIETYKALGAIPTPIPYSELVTALQGGVIDGADQGLTAYLSNKHFQIAPFFAHIDVVQTLSVFFMSKRIWDKLPKELRGPVEKAANEAVKEQIQLYEGEVRNYEKVAKESKFPFGYTFPDLTEFREAVKPVYVKYEKEFGKDIFQRILNLK